LIPLFACGSPPPAQQPTEHTKSKIMNFRESSLFEMIGNHRRTVTSHANDHQRFLRVMCFEKFGVVQKVRLILAARYMEKLIL